MSSQDKENQLALFVAAIEKALADEGATDHIRTELKEKAAALGLKDLDAIVAEVKAGVSDQVQATVELRTLIDADAMFDAAKHTALIKRAGKNLDWVNDHRVKIGAAVGISDAELDAVSADISLSITPDLDRPVSTMTADRSSRVQSVKKPKNSSPSVGPSVNKGTMIKSVVAVALLSATAYASYDWYQDKKTVEVADWQAAQAANNKQAYEAHINRWTEGYTIAGLQLFATFDQQARDRLATLDQQAFEKAKEAGDPVAFAAYLKDWPNGQFQTAIAELTAAYGEQENDWVRAKAQNTIDGYLAFIKRYKKSDFATQARSALQQLRAAEAREKARIAQERYELVKSTQRLLSQIGFKVAVDGRYGSQTAQIVKKAQAQMGVTETGNVTTLLISQLETEARRIEGVQWQAAKKAGSLQALRAFEKRWTETRFTKEISAQRTKIQQELKRRAEKAAADKAYAEADEKAWDSAKSKDTIPAYRGYMITFPDGLYLDDAELGIEAIEGRSPEAEKAWKVAVSAKSDAALADFMGDWPGSPRKNEVWARRCVMAAGSADGNVYGYAGADLQDIAAGPALDYCSAAVEAGIKEGDVYFALAQAQLITAKPVEAKANFESAAEMGSVAAMKSLAALAYSDGRTAEYRKYLEMAGAAGDQDVISRLAFMYETGTNMPEDHKRAVYWYRKAAEFNDKTAIYRLYQYYDQGRAGVPKDDRRRLYWLEKAAQFNEDAIHVLIARAYQNGRGTAVNVPQALVWFERLAARGNEIGLVNAAQIYAKDTGPHRDLQQALDIFTKLAMGSGAYAEQAAEWKSFVEAEIFREQEEARIKRQGHPDPIERTSARYPSSAARKGIEGQVKVGFTIDVTGEVLEPIILSADPVDVFEKAAIRAIKRWKFTPQRKDGVVVPLTGQFAVFQFRLKTQSDD